MTRSLRGSLWSTPLAAIAIATLTMIGCGGDEGAGPGVGGRGGGGGRGGTTGSAGRGGTTGNAGSGGGAAGAAGVAGRGGTTGNAGSGGGAAGSTGIAGTGGGGVAGATGNAGRGGTTGTAGTGGAAAGTTGTAGTGGAAAGTTGNAGTGGAAAGTAGTAGTGGAAAGTTGNAGTGGAAAGTTGTAGNTGGGGGAATCAAGTACALPGSVSGVCSNNTCAACPGENAAGDAACVGAYGAGKLCVGGNCITGNCRTAANCNNTAQICSNNVCGTCGTNDGACVSAYGANHLCQGGACVVGNCRAKGDCMSGGLICNTGTLLCNACGADADCVNEYGNNQLCINGACVAGNCKTSQTCSGGQICNQSTHFCGGCGSGATGDAACVAELGANKLCEGNACINGNCRVAANCNDPTRICTGNFCAGCTTSAQCTAAYGQNHVCVAGSCQAGNCVTSAECGTGQLCVGNTCQACAAGAAGDAACIADTRYGAAHICLSGQCLPGDCHNTSADCDAGELCNNTTHTCGTCAAGAAGDTACKADARYGTAFICLTGACTQGDCHDTSTECPPGQLCGPTGGTAHTCGPCAAGATGDTQCTSDARYGAGNICVQGACGPGNCHGTSADCTGGNAGRICGVPTANTCGACTSDSQCTADAAYGSGTICNTTAGANQGRCVSSTCASNNTTCAANTSDFCCSMACVAGNCCNDNDCANNGNFGLGFACLNNNCTQCSPVSGSRYLVDPVNGNDTTANGSGMSGAASAPGCAFKTIARALQVIPPSPPPGTRIVLVGQAGGPAIGLAETLPITLPTNTTLTTQTGPITINLLPTAAGNAAGFRLLNNGSAIAGDPAAPLVLEGNNTSGIAIQVSASMPTFTSSISNVSIFRTGGDGIRVTAGALTIGGGVVVSAAAANADGLRVTGGTATINNPAGSQTLFTFNGRFGIEVTGLGGVSIVGTPGAPIPSNNGTVLSTFNSEGILIQQNAGAANRPLNDINGLVAWGNSARDARFRGGSRVRVRNSVFGAGLEAIRIDTGVNGATAAQNNDISEIDLGTGTSFGRNYIQMPNGSLGFHPSAGICLALAGLQAAQHLNATGNFMTTLGNPGGQLDCSTTGGTVGASASCSGRVSFGNATPVTTTITRDFAMCN